MEEESRQEPQASAIKKKVDESWKNAVEKEKSTSLPPGSQATPEPQTGKEEFIYFISGLGMQALAALGEIPGEGDVTGPADLGQAQQLIDVLELLSLKTKNNLSVEEKTTLEQLLYQLRVKFVQKNRAVE